MTENEKFLIEYKNFLHEEGMKSFIERISTTDVKYDISMKKKDFEKLKKDFDTILNNVWCRISFHKGEKFWNEIKFSVEKPCRFEIQQTIGLISMDETNKESLKYKIEDYLNQIKICK